MGILPRPCWELLTSQYSPARQQQSVPSLRGASNDLWRKQLPAGSWQNSHTVRTALTRPETPQAAQGDSRVSKSNRGPAGTARQKVLLDARSGPFADLPVEGRPCPPVLPTRTAECRR